MKKYLAVCWFDMTEFDTLDDAVRHVQNWKPNRLVYISVDVSNREPDAGWLSIPVLVELDKHPFTLAKIGSIIEMEVNDARSLLEIYNEYYDNEKRRVEREQS